jgi:hypothetical protein
MAIIFKQRVQDPTIKDLRSFVRKTVTRDRSLYQTESQWDNETTFINRQRDQLKDQYGYMWEDQGEPLVKGEFGNLKITDTEISFRPKRYAPTEIYVAARWYCMCTETKFTNRARLA